MIAAFAGFRASWRAATVLPLILLLGSSGCSKQKNAGPDEPVPVQQLREIFHMAQMRTKGSQVRPKQLSDFKQSEQAYPNAYQALRSGECVFLWSAYQNTLADKATTVLAYEKDAPKQGGYVVM